MSQPIHIVMTPVRNEAWVLRAFLETTSLWADYIIIADQMSTDGSREIAREYSKVIMIDNNNPDFNEDERQALLVAKAREVGAGRDTLLWGLDADEILSANFRETKDWQRILDSAPGDVFWFKWATICPDWKEYRISPTTYYPWLFHDDGNTPHSAYVRNMHSMRIPYPEEEKSLYYVDDFKVLHLACLNKHRVSSKHRFYQFVDWEMNHRHFVKLSRNYNRTIKNECTFSLPDSFLYKEKCGLDLFDLVDTEVSNNYMDEYIVERLSRHSIKDLRKLNIWDEEFIQAHQLMDPRRPLDRCVHKYLDETARNADSLGVRIIDKLLKLIY